METKNDYFCQPLISNLVKGVDYLGSQHKSDKELIAFNGFVSMISIRVVAEKLNQALNDPTLIRLTRERIKKQIDVYKNMFQFLFDLYKPLGIDRFSLEDYQRATSNGQKPENIMEYWHNIFRDWSPWGEHEIQENLKLLEPLLQMIPSNSECLYLGAGACRLPYELHLRLKPKTSIFMDFNPLLLSIASRIIQGEKFQLNSFPRYPLEIADALSQEPLSCANPNSPNIQFVRNNALDWQIKPNSFSFIATFWFIDIFDQDVRKTISQIYEALKPGGIWLNLGPLCFDVKDVPHYYSKDEIEHFILKENFTSLHSSLNRVPYLEHSASGSWRNEKIWLNLAKKP